MELKHRTKHTGLTLCDQQFPSENVVQNQQFFSSLTHYTSVFKITNSRPLFLQNCQTPSSTILLVILCALSILLDICLWNIIQEQNANYVFFRVIFWLNCAILLIMVIFYILAIKLNPGIVNLSKISAKVFKEFGQEYCIYCQQYRTYKMYHCIKCGVCIQNYDHHCMVLGRCVGGKQKRAFQGFLVTLGLQFASLIIGGICTLTQI